MAGVKHFVAKTGISTTKYDAGTKVLVNLSLKKRRD